MKYYFGWRQDLLVFAGISCGAEKKASYEGKEIAGSDVHLIRLIWEVNRLNLYSLCFLIVLLKWNHL